MTQEQIELLKDGYFALRKQSSILRDGGQHLEGLRWVISDEAPMISRSKDGWTVTVYQIEGQIEACLCNPDGTSKTFC